MSQSKQSFSKLKALYINCSLKETAQESHTQKLLDRSANIMAQEGVAVEHLYMRDHQIAFGMVEDATQDGQKDDWPQLQKKVMEAHILVIGSPIWLGQKSSLATLLIERMYAYSGHRNEKDQYLYYGKVGGCIITGNEDGVKHCAMDLLYALQHIGYTIPPQADAGWIGEVGPGPSYGDTEWNDQKFNPPVGFESDFTNRNTTFMTWNLMHMAALLKKNDGLPAKGNTTSDWQNVTNATDQNPEYR